MREIDEVRITLLRALRHHAGGTLPQVSYGLPPMFVRIMKSINQITLDRFKLLSSIKLQAYGRGLLVRLRDLKLVTTRTITSGRNYDWLTIRWDNDKLVERARGDRALRGSRTALNTPMSAIWRGFYTNFYTYNQRVDDNWSSMGYDETYGVGRHPYSRTEGRRPKVWDRWITRRLKVQAHYNMRHRLGVKLLDFGEP
jgi:hypothetical protein